MKLTICFIVLFLSLTSAWADPPRTLLNAFGLRYCQSNVDVNQGIEAFSQHLSQRPSHYDDPADFDLLLQAAQALVDLQTQFRVNRYLNCKIANQLVSQASLGETSLTQSILVNEVGEGVQPLVLPTQKAALLDAAAALIRASLESSRDPKEYVSRLGEVYDPQGTVAPLKALKRALRDPATNRFQFERKFGVSIGMLIVGMNQKYSFHRMVDLTTRLGMARRTAGGSVEFSPPANLLELGIEPRVMLEPIYEHLLPLQSDPAFVVAFTTVAGLLDKLPLPTVSLPEGTARPSRIGSLCRWIMGGGRI